MMVQKLQVTTADTSQSKQYQQQFHLQVTEVQSNYAASQHSSRNTRNACSDYQEAIAKTLETLFESIAKEQEASKCREFVLQHEKSLLPKKSQYFDLKKLGISASLSVREIAPPKTQLSQPILAIGATSANSGTSRTNEKFTTFLHAMSNTLEDLLAYQSQFDSKYAYYLSGPLQFLGNSTGQQISSRLFHIVSEFTEYENEFLHQLDGLLESSGMGAAKGLGFVHNHRTYRQESTQMNKTLTQIFVNTINQFEETGTILESELNKIRGLQRTFSEKAIRSMRVKIEQQQGQTPEITRVYTELIKTAENARWSGFEAFLQIYAAIQKDYLICLMMSLKRVAVIKVAQKREYVDALATRIQHQICMNLQTAGDGVDEVSTLPIVDDFNNWKNSEQYDFDDFNFKELVETQVMTMIKFIVHT